MATVSHRNRADNRFIVALRHLRDPLLLFVVPMVWAVLAVALAYVPAWGIGFDFAGTLWKPANALLDGESMYPQPIREAMVIGNPSVYPPPTILLSLPLAFLPVTLAAWVWFCILGASVFAAMWIIGVRDWRCHVLAVTSPVVVHGLTFGNITILLVPAIAIAWRCRSNARVSGVAVGAAVAAKLFVWPLVVWLVLTRRYRAAAWAMGSAAMLLLGSWAIVGFDGLADYPALLDALQDVYADHSASLATVAGATGIPLRLSIALCWLAGFVLLALAAVLVRRDDGDRRGFTVVILACIVGSTIVWPNYAALLFVPIAVTWPRLAPAWFFGYAIWIAGLLVPKTTFVEPPGRPDDVPLMAWSWSHSDPLPWYAAGVTGIVLAVGLYVVRRPRATVVTP